MLGAAVALLNDALYDAEAHAAACSVDLQQRQTVVTALTEPVSGRLLTQQTLMSDHSRDLNTRAGWVRNLHCDNVNGKADN